MKTKLNPKLKRVRSLILRNFIGSALITFIMFALLSAMFGFELEDEIFDHQVRVKADQLTAAFPAIADSGIVGGVEMQYFIGMDAMPEWMQERIDPEWPVGRYEIFAEEFGHFHVAVRQVGDGKLYLLFNARPYIRSTPQIIAYLKIVSGIAALALMISLFFIYRMTKRVTAPIEKMAEVLATGDAAEVAGDLDDGALVELRALVHAINSRDQRIQSLLDRERQFNRDASHELRTPLSVAMGAAEVLESAGAEGAAFGRLKTALADMQHLTEGILWLSRDPSSAHKCKPAAVGTEAISAYKHLLQNRSVRVELIEEAQGVVMPVPTAVAQVMIGNIIRNAFSYTEEGAVTIEISPGALRVTDTGVGFGNADQSTTGFGIGLSLVERLCQHFGLTLDVGAGPERGTVAVISWEQ
ncbi:MAG: two-component sensor histidine kinase [Kordiimonadales bacterium]|nr:MAG: two-component sensor histidine kinase [Kordiimonadales bacterium]